MKNIELTYNVEDFINESYYDCLWPNSRKPTEEMTAYWKDTLSKWLEEWTGDRKGMKFDTFTQDAPSKGQIRVLNGNDEHESLAFVLVDKKTNTKTGEDAWFYCVISPMSVPATMWEFKEEDIVFQTWNTGATSEDVILSITKPADKSISEKTCDKIMHFFNLQIEHERLDVPMNTVGPRIFRTDDPRKTYQRDYANASEILYKASQAKAKTNTYTNTNTNPNSNL